MIWIFLVNFLDGMVVKNRSGERHRWKSTKRSDETICAVLTEFTRIRNSKKKKICVRDISRPE